MNEDATTVSYGNVVSRHPVDEQKTIADASLGRKFKTSQDRNPSKKKKARLSLDKDPPVDTDSRPTLETVGYQTEITQISLGNTLIFCGCFLCTNDPNMYDFISKIFLKENGAVVVSGYHVRKIGEAYLVTQLKFLY